MTECNSGAAHLRSVGGEPERSSDVRFSQFWICTDDICDGFSGSKHLKHEIHHDTSTLENWLAVSDARIRYDILREWSHTVASIAHTYSAENVEYSSWQSQCVAQTQ